MDNSRFWQIASKLSLLSLKIENWRDLRSRNESRTYKVYDRNKQRRQESLRGSIEAESIAPSETVVEFLVETQERGAKEEATEGQEIYTLNLFRAGDLACDLLISRIKSLDVMQVHPWTFLGKNA